jgi:hypothetical protein
VVPFYISFHAHEKIIFSLMHRMMHLYGWLRSRHQTDTYCHTKHSISPLVRQDIPISLYPEDGEASIGRNHEYREHAILIPRITDKNIIDNRYHSGSVGYPQKMSGNNRSQ